jgi:hypothetical protein
LFVGAGVLVVADALEKVSGQDWVFSTHSLKAKPGDPSNPRVANSNEEIGFLAGEREAFGECHVLTEG